MIRHRHWAASHLWILIGLFGTAMLVGCAEIEPAAVSWYYGPGIRFHGLGSTFAWSPHESEKRPYHHHGPPAFERLARKIIENAVETNGFRQAAPESADFWLDYRVGKREVEDSMVNPHGEVFAEGTLVLDVVDPKSNELIWRGVVQARIDDTAPPEAR